MNRKFLTAVAAAALLVGTAANASPLDGQTVMVNLTAGGIDFGTQSVIVGAGDEGNYFGNTFFDLNGGVNGDEFVYTSTGGYCGIVCSGDAVCLMHFQDAATHRQLDVSTYGDLGDRNVHGVDSQLGVTGWTVSSTALH